MNNLARSGALVVLLVAGLASGVGLTRVLGGDKSADPCFGSGAGSLQRVITVPEDGNKQYNVCSKLGQEVIFDAKTGEAVTTSLRENELIDYYKQHPEENPRAIADKTADAGFAVTSFTQVSVPPVPTDGTCPSGASRVEYKQVAMSICQPDDWKVIEDNEAGVTIGNKVTLVGIYPDSLKGTTGTKCATPQEIELAWGIAKLCAFHVDALGGQGHGIILPSGREMGMSFLKGVSDDQRTLGYLVAFSVQEVK